MQIRKIFTHIEETRLEAGVNAEIPLRKVAVVAVLKNPFAGRPFQEDLSELTEASAEIGRDISERAATAMNPFEVASYGKGGIVGLAGEQEHVVAMLTTVYGNAMREAAGGGAAWISSFTRRGGPGEILQIPLAHKDALYVRSHYDGMEVYLSDAPLPDEIAIVCCYANRGRLNARVGGIAAEQIEGKDGLR